MNIRIENLSKRYGPQTAVDKISFEVKTGEILGFLGPNGAGKSTSMKMITGYLGIGEGDVFINEQSTREQGPELRRHIGYLPENNPLYLDMPVIVSMRFFVIEITRGCSSFAPTNFPAFSRNCEIQYVNCRW